MDVHIKLLARSAIWSGKAQGKSEMIISLIYKEQISSISMKACRVCRVLVSKTTQKKGGV